MPCCEVGGHLLVCAEASVVVGTAMVAHEVVVTRRSIIRLGLHEVIELRCGRPKMVSEKVALGVGISKNLWASADRFVAKI